MLPSRGCVFAVELGGEAMVKGITARQGVPMACEVRVYHRQTGLLLSKMTSKTNGKYRLLGTHKGNYVIALDPQDEMNLARHDRV